MKSRQIKWLRFKVAKETQSHVQAYKERVVASGCSTVIVAFAINLNFSTDSPRAEKEVTLTADN